MKKKENKNKENKKNKKGEELKKGGYQVQVSVNRKKEYAIALKEKLILKGYHAYIYESESNNIPIYIVYIGPFVKMEDAQDTKKYLEQDFKNLSGSYILKN